MIRKMKQKLLSTALVLATATSLFSLNVFASDDVVTIGDFTYKRTSETVGGREVDTWMVTGYHGSNTSVVIPDAIDAENSNEIENVESNELQNNLLAGNMVTELSDSVFSGSDVESIKLPGYLMKAKSNLFDEAVHLKEITGAGKLSANGFKTDGTALYNNKTLLIFPKAFVGEYEVAAETNRYASGIFEGTSFEKLILTRNLSYGSEAAYNRGLFVGASIKEVKLNNTTIDEKSFLGAEIGIFTGDHTISGSLVSGNKLYYYGYDSDYDFSGISEISSVAFQSEGLLKSVEDQIPEAMKNNTVFRFYNGTGSEHTQRYFNVNGKTAFCYDYGKENPEVVGELLKYDNTIEPNTTKYNQIRALLYGGVPNNGTGLFEEVFGKDYDELSYGIVGDAAKNAVGALVWEIVSGKTVDINGIYGINDENFTKSEIKEYVSELRSRYIDKADSFDLADFELGFYHPNKPASAQRLVVINEIYRPEVPEKPNKPSITISKKDITTKEELAGATLQVFKDGKIIEEWVSTNEPHAINDLEDGEYTLVEFTAPNGYQVAESIEFSVKDGKVSTSQITMYDTPLADEYIYISKQDITSKKELPGAKLVLKQNGEIIDQWTSTNEPHKIKNLADGEYEFIELMAPKGYDIAKTIIFTVKDGKTEVSPIIMYDELTPSPTPKPTKPGGNYSGGEDPEPTTKTPVTEINTPETTPEIPTEPRPIPQTGDIAGVIKVMMGILVTFGVGYVIKRKVRF